MAELFLAKDTRQSSRIVVLKRILPYLAEEADFVRMFLDEARIAAALHHPSIVELFELGHLEGSTFIAMEWVDGIDLRRIAQREQEKGEVLPAGIAAWIAARLCEGLFHAHSARDVDGKVLGIIHRDVSPQNVMLSFHGDVKLVDFGIAKATAWMGRSKPGVIKGKFLYLAPEQLTTDPLDHRTDLFALGTMLYELTTGQSPFYRTSTEAVIYAIRIEEPDPPSKVRPGFPQALSRIILKCLVKDREQRYQTADEVRRDLEEFIRLDAPTTRDDVVAYVSKLFGDDNERTGIFIPSNAQTQGDLQPIQDPPALVKPPTRRESRTDTSTARDAPFEKLDEERTMPLTKEAVASMRAAAAAKVPEGRRETGETLKPSKIGEGDEVPTGPTRNDRLKGRLAQSTEPAKANPWEPEVTAPLAAALPQKSRDFVMTAELSGDEKPALDGPDFPPTAVSRSGARELAIGDVFKPLMPTMMGLSSPEVTRAAPATPAPVRAKVGMKPGPPVPLGESIPELDPVSVVSAGEATIGAIEDFRKEDEPEEPSEPSEPSPPAPSTRAPPRTGQLKRPQPIKRPVPGDPDDEVETVDQQNEFSVTRRSSSQKVLIGIFGAAGLVVVVLLILLFAAGDSGSTDKPKPPTSTPTPTRQQTVATPTLPETPVGPAQMRILLRAAKGTQLLLDGKPVQPDETILRGAGELVLKFTCPPRKKMRPQPGTLRAQIPESDQLVVVEVPCR